MASVEFIYNGIMTEIQCQEFQKMEEICNNFIRKSNLNQNEIYYFYDGKSNAQFNKNLTFSQMINSIDKSRKKMSILVYNIENNQNNKSKIKSKTIICPQCNEDIKMSVKNYKINLFECKNNHKKNDILFKDFESTQLIDLMNIKCGACKDSNKYNTYQNQFYKCFDCNINLCPLCKNKHDKKHNIYNYDKINILCNKHNESFTNYCKTCKRNICYLCEEEHNEHDIILLRKMMKNKNELMIKLDELKKSINLFKDYINKIMEILNNVKDNLDNYYKIEEYIFNNYDKNERNYEILYNINELINFNDIIIKDINNENNIENKFLNIINIYNKINFNASRVKITIEQYENKIKDLEEKLRQKNLAFDNLKNNNFQNLWGMGMAMNPKQLNENKNNNISDIISINFRLSGSSNIPPIVIKAFKDDEFEIAQKRFLKKVIAFGNLKFIFNCKEVNPILTVSELGMFNNSNIFVLGNKFELKKEENFKKDLKDEEEEDLTNKKQLIFKTTQGINHTMYFSPHISIGLAIQKYLKRVGRLDLIDSCDKRLAFLYNASQFTIKDKTTLNKLFQTSSASIIIVNDVNNLIGA